MTALSRSFLWQELIYNHLEKFLCHVLKHFDTQCPNRIFYSRNHCVSFHQVHCGKHFINHLPLFRFPVYYFSVIPPLKSIASIDFHPFIQRTPIWPSKFWLELAPHPRAFHQLFYHLIQFTASPLKAWPYLFIPLFISVLTWGCLMSRSSSYFRMMLTLSFQVKLLLGTQRQSIYFIFSRFLKAEDKLSLVCLLSPYKTLGHYAWSAYGFLSMWRKFCFNLGSPINLEDFALLILTIIDNTNREENIVSMIHPSSIIKEI